MDSKPTAVTTLSNFMSNKAVSASSQELLSVVSPHDGQTIAMVPLSTAADVDKAVESAKSAFTEWSGLTLKARAGYLLTLYNTLTENSEELVDLIVREHGKNKAEARGDVSKGLETLEYAISLPQIAQGRVEYVSGGVQCQDERVPLGVVGGIVPFNFPFMVPFWTIPIAIGMGNTYVLKPSEKVPMTMTRVAELAANVLPPGVLNIVHGDRTAAQALLEHKDVQALAFVGTSEVAQHIHTHGTSLGKRVLALGGAKNHLLALKDCDVDMTAQDVVNSFTGCAGERCMAASVLLVVGEQPKLISKIVEKAQALVPGSEGTRSMGPVIDQQAIDRIEGAIRHAVDVDGAQLLLDGCSSSAFASCRKETGGFWIGPTVLQHKSWTDKAMHFEIFGPVLSILQCSSIDEALAIENANSYGNAACVYTTSGAAAEYCSRRFQAAMIGVNIGVPVPREPFSFGGINRSKFGTSDITGDGGIEFFSYRRKITTKWAPPKKDASWMS
ncbi:aldehyde dehydrogenase (NADP(+)) ald6 [Coemansia spiralis]|uniref:Aldehyde dehydrogenase (NADP(+)) ald6 n=2 Tax=Coemansia TaxID=4863 RepID=A0A9W8G4W7_9FUNG|nr:aldehyde dehydrogenase (NADP(+)) ald6 [Coemansia umbellata]KAJ2621174.1 aldehyde dehydrogenase (NADP(+)) ald6 [Coemansia sp. RSA 1358]KAJ2673094.1 aldehyde dehydrogenase (NADP(+)) ald6 [Coemansia spiralis]